MKRWIIGEIIFAGTCMVLGSVLTLIAIQNGLLPFTCG